MLGKDAHRSKIISSWNHQTPSAPVTFLTAEMRELTGSSLRKKGSFWPTDEGDSPLPAGRGWVETKNQLLMGLNHKTSRSIPSDPLLLVRPCHLNIQTPSQTVPPAGYQVFELMSQWWTFHIWATTPIADLILVYGWNSIESKAQLLQAYLQSWPHKKTGEATCIWECRFPNEVWFLLLLFMVVQILPLFIMISWVATSDNLGV